MCLARIDFLMIFPKYLHGLIKSGRIVHANEKVLQKHFILKQVSGKLTLFAWPFPYSETRVWLQQHYSCGVKSRSNVSTERMPNLSIVSNHSKILKLGVAQLKHRLHGVTLWQQVTHRHRRLHENQAGWLTWVVDSILCELNRFRTVGLWGHKISEKLNIKKRFLDYCANKAHSSYTYEEIHAAFIADFFERSTIFNRDFFVVRQPDRFWLEQLCPN